MYKTGSVIALGSKGQLKGLLDSRKSCSGRKHFFLQDLCVDNCRDYNEAANINLHVWQLLSVLVCAAYFTTKFVLYMKKWFVF